MLAGLGGGLGGVQVLVVWGGVVVGGVGGDRRGGCALAGGGVVAKVFGGGLGVGGASKGREEVEGRKWLERESMSVGG